MVSWLTCISLSSGWSRANICGDESGAPPVIHPRFDRRAQPVIAEFEGLGPAGLLGSQTHWPSGRDNPRQEGGCGWYSRQTTERSRPSRLADLGEAQPHVAATHDLHALFEADPMARAAGPSEISLGRPTHPDRSCLCVASSRQRRATNASRCDATRPASPTPLSWPHPGRQDRRTPASPPSKPEPQTSPQPPKSSDVALTV